MQIEVRPGDLATHDGGVVVVLCLQGGELPSALVGLVEEADFSAAPNQTVVAYPRGAVAARRVVLVGLGPADALDEEGIRQAAASAIRAARPFGEASVVVSVPGDLAVSGARLGEALATGLELGAYRFLRHRTNLTDNESFEVESVVLLSDDAAMAEGVATGQALARGVILARDLVNTPGAMKTPPRLFAVR